MHKINGGDITSYLIPVDTPIVIADIINTIELYIITVSAIVFIFLAN